jgi:hypothetical protein
MKRFEFGIVKMDLESKAIQVQSTIVIEINSMKKYKSTSVESFITKHVPIIERFVVFFSFLNQIKQFLCHWMCKLEGYKWHQNGRLLLFSLSPISLSFWVCFEWFNLMCALNKVLQNFFEFQK